MILKLQNNTIIDSKDILRLTSFEPGDKRSLSYLVPGSTPIQENQDEIRVDVIPGSTPIQENQYEIRVDVIAGLPLSLKYEDPDLFYKDLDKLANLMGDKNKIIEIESVDSLVIKLSEIIGVRLSEPYETDNGDRSALDIITKHMVHHVEFVNKYKLEGDTETFVKSSKDQAKETYNMIIKELRSL